MCFGLCLLSLLFFFSLQKPHLTNDTKSTLVSMSTHWFCLIEASQIDSPPNSIQQSFTCSETLNTSLFSMLLFQRLNVNRNTSHSSINIGFRLYHSFTLLRMSSWLSISFLKFCTNNWKQGQIKTSGKKSVGQRKTRFGWFGLCLFW